MMTPIRPLLFVPPARRRRGAALLLIGASLLVAGLGFLLGKLYLDLRFTQETDRALHTRERMNAAIRLIAVTLADEDGDGILEGRLGGQPGSQAPSGGSLVPEGIGAGLDGWNRAFGFCLWNHGAAAQAGEFGLAGVAEPSSTVMVALISAGADGIFQTGCAEAYDPLARLAGDDIGDRWRYSEMLELTARISGVDDGRGSIAYRGPGGVGIGMSTSVPAGGPAGGGSGGTRLAVDGDIAVSGVATIADALLEGALTLTAAGSRLSATGTAIAGSLVATGDSALREIGGADVLIDPTADCMPGRIRVTLGELQICGPSGWTPGGAPAGAP